MNTKNETTIISQIEELVNKFPNDMDLGKIIREYINEIKKTEKDFD